MCNPGTQPEVRVSRSPSGFTYAMRLPIWYSRPGGSGRPRGAGETAGSWCGCSPAARTPFQSAREELLVVGLGHARKLGRVLVGHARETDEAVAEASVVGEVPVACRPLPLARGEGRGPADEELLGWVQHLAVVELHGARQGLGFGESGFLRGRLEGQRRAEEPGVDEAVQRMARPASAPVSWPCFVSSIGRHPLGEVDGRPSSDPRGSCRPRA